MDPFPIMLPQEIISFTNIYEESMKTAETKKLKRTMVSFHSIWVLSKVSRSFTNISPHENKKVPRVVSLERDIRKV